jgi:hypothetical protein
MRQMSFSLVVMLTVAYLADAEEKKTTAITVSEISDKMAMTTIDIVEGKLTVCVNSRSRSGTMTLTSGKNTWPEQVTILFEGFDALEHFSVSTGRMYTNGSKGTSGKFGQYLLGNDRDFNKRTRIGTLDIRIEPHQKGMLVTFPDKLFLDASQVQFGWVTWLDR